MRIDYTQDEDGSIWAHVYNTDGTFSHWNFNNDDEGQYEIIYNHARHMNT